MELVAVIIAGAVTAVATGLGAIPVFLLGQRAERLRPLLSAVAAAVMALASVVGLLLPALDDGTPGVVLAGLVLGVAFVVAARTRLAHDRRFGGQAGAGARTAVLVFAVLFVHSIPEGLAIGAAWASEHAGLGIFMVAAIALQNVPEGTAVAIPMAAAGQSRARQFWAAVGSSAPQPFGAAIAFLLVEQVRAILPLSLAFAAGAMLTVVVAELLPDALGRHRPAAVRRTRSALRRAGLRRRGSASRGL
jgi:ZIP family zinc transporter